MSPMWNTKLELGLKSYWSTWQISSNCDGLEDLIRVEKNFIGLSREERAWIEDWLRRPFSSEQICFIVDRSDIWFIWIFGREWEGIG